MNSTTWWSANGDQLKWQCLQHHHDVATVEDVHAKDAHHNDQPTNNDEHRLSVSEEAWASMN
jgi:hypothetical protein